MLQEKKMSHDHEKCDETVVSIDGIFPKSQKHKHNAKKKRNRLKGEVRFDILSADVSLLPFESEHRHEHKFETDP